MADIHKDGIVTLDGMKAAISAGGSVQLRDGRIITKVEDLPKVSELAKDDPSQARDALKQLNAQMKEQAAEIERLKNITAGKNPDGSTKEENQPDDPPT